MFGYVSNIHTHKHSLTVDTFETVEEADRAKDALNGADIYSGCCTLKVEWGKVCCHFVGLCLEFCCCICTPPYAPWSSNLAQNRPLWRMMSTYGATQSWVACQKLRWSVVVVSRHAATQLSSYFLVCYCMIFFVINMQKNSGGENKVVTSVVYRLFCIC